MIATSTLAAGGGTRGMEGTIKRLQTRSPLLSRRRGKRQVISWAKRRRNSSIFEIRATPHRWRISYQRKGRTVVVIPRTPMQLESPMVRMQKQFWWLIHCPSKTCRRVTESLLTIWIYIFRQSSVTTSNTSPLSTVLFIRLDVLDNLWHYLQSHAFVMVYSVGLNLEIFICVTTEAI